MQLLNLHEIHFSKPVPFLWQILAEKFQLLADEHDEPMSRNRGGKGALTNWLSVVWTSYSCNKDDQCLVKGARRSEGCLLFLCLYCWGRGGYLKLEGRWNTCIIGLAVEAAKSLQSGPSQWLPLPVSFFCEVSPFFSSLSPLLNGGQGGNQCQEDTAPFLLIVTYLKSLAVM